MPPVNKIWIGDDTGNVGDWGTAANWSPSGVPAATDHVFLTSRSTQSIIDTLDQSAIALGSLTVEPGYSGSVGVITDGALSYLQIDPDEFIFEGTGISYIDLTTAAIDAVVVNAATPGGGRRGLYLKGSALDLVTIRKGSVGIAAQPGDTATITDVVVTGEQASYEIGEGTTLTNLIHWRGTGSIECPATAVEVRAGKLTTDGDGAIATITISGGNLVPNSGGTVTTLNIDGGVVDAMRSGRDRTFSTVVLGGKGQRGHIKYDPDVVTITTLTAPTYPHTLDFEPIT